MVINDIQFNADLIDIISELKVQLYSNGIELFSKINDTPTDLMVCCPYHKNGQERKPSSGIRKSDGLFHCFTCNETHSLQEVISYCLGYKNDMIGVQGWNWLLRNFASVKIDNRVDIDLDLDRVNRAFTKPTQYVSESELDSYRYIHPYMYKRKLTDEVIDLFDIGYDKATQCITFPVRDIEGNTLFIARRSVNTKYFNYPSGAEKPLYGIYEYFYVKHNETLYNANLSEIVVCESMLDALAFWAVGKCAVALNGLGTELQYKQLNDLPCRTIILCTDMDSAGMSARKRLRKNIKTKLIAEYYLPSGRKDANDCTQDELLKLEKIF